MDYLTMRFLVRINPAVAVGDRLQDEEGETIGVALSAAGDDLPVARPDYSRGWQSWKPGFRSTDPLAAHSWL
jgi:hypothetical protein